MHTSYISASPSQSLDIQLLGLECLSQDSNSSKSTMTTEDLFFGASSSLVGDYIGLESCVDMVKDDEEEDRRAVADVSETYIERLRCKKDQFLAMTKKDFPPPIPSLARTENLPSHMPWILKRHYTSDGRLILTEEKVKHHEYFRAHRSNGRLTLQLVPMDGEISGPPSEENDVVDGEEELSGATENIEGDDCDEEDNVDGDCDSEMDGCDDEEESKIGNEGIVNGGNGSGSGKCLSYSSVIIGSRCKFDVPVPAIRPVPI
ncbi:hypothetical protein UlMin_035412 [Ulmus minor]